MASWAYLLRCAGAREMWFGPGAWTPPFGHRVNHLLGLPPAADERHLHSLCDDGVFDCRPGDVIVTEIEGLGALQNTIE